MVKLLNALKNNRKGNVAILFGVAAIPLMGFVGGAVDYSRATALKSEMRSIADRAALAVVLELNNLSEQEVHAQSVGELLMRYGQSLQDITVEGAWIDAVHYRIVVRADLRSSLLGAIPLTAGVIPTSIETVARRPDLVWSIGEPDLFPLAAEANDYNRVYSYCFNPGRVDDEDKGRRDIRPLFDNGVPPTEYDEGVSQCNGEEMLSFKLRNVRSARKTPERWDDPSRRVYNYFTDTRLDPDTGVLIHDHKGYRVRSGWRFEEITLDPDTLETVLCPTREDCVTIAEGGVLPDYQDNREANVATDPCEPGQYMYFAWEDRPTGHGWTDMDFNDIRFVISCPELGASDTSVARIVR